MAHPTSVFRHTLLDGMGLPLSGGRVEIYVAGTTTRATAYRDRELTVPHEWPVALDVGGHATIYLPPGSYKFRTLDRAGALQHEVDQVDLGVSTLSRDFIDLPSIAQPPPAGPIQARLYYSQATTLLYASIQGLPYRPLWAMVTYLLGGDYRAVVADTLWVDLPGGSDVEIDTGLLVDRKASFSVVASILGPLCGRVRLMDVTGTPTEVAGSLMTIGTATPTLHTVAVTLPAGVRRYRVQAQAHVSSSPLSVADARLVLWGKREGHTDVAAVALHTDHTDAVHADHTDHTDHADTTHSDATVPHSDHTDITHGDHTDAAPHADHTDHTDHADTLHDDVLSHNDHTDHTDHADHADHTDHTDHADHADHADHLDHTDFGAPHEDITLPHEDHTDHSDTTVPHEDHTDHSDTTVPHEDHSDHLDHTDAQHSDQTAPHGDHNDTTHDDHTDTAPHADHTDHTDHTDAQHSDQTAPHDDHADTTHDDAACSDAHKDVTP